MSKLFPFEKTFEIVLDKCEVNSPYGIWNVKPFDTIEYNYTIKNYKLNKVKYEFIRYCGDTYCHFYITVGRRVYCGYIKSIDFTLVSCLFDKFLKINKVKK